MLFEMPFDPEEFLSRYSLQNEKRLSEVYGSIMNGNYFLPEKEYQGKFLDRLYLCIEDLKTYGEDITREVFDFLGNGLLADVLILYWALPDIRRYCSEDVYEIAYAGEIERSLDFLRSLPQTENFAAEIFHKVCYVPMHCFLLVWDYLDIEIDFSYQIENPYFVGFQLQEEKSGSDLEIDMNLYLFMKLTQNLSHPLRDEYLRQTMDLDLQEKMAGDRDYIDQITRLKQDLPQV